MKKMALLSDLVWGWNAPQEMWVCARYLLLDRPRRVHNNFNILDCR